MVDWRWTKTEDSFFENCRDLQFGLKLTALGAWKSALGSFARAISIASLVCASSGLL